MRQMAQKFQDIKGASPLFKGVPSWIKYARKSIGMTPDQLSKRIGIAKSSLHQLERQEAQGKANLRSLEKAANAMGFELIYAFVPRASVEVIVNEQAHKKAKTILSDSKLQMEYEDQAVQSQQEMKELFDKLIQDLKSSKQLWED